MKTPKQEDIVTLEIASWVGISAGASHCYGFLKSYKDGQYPSIELKKKLTKYDAETLNSIDNHTSYKEGHKSKRFNSEDEVRKEAISIWKSEFPEAKILVEGLTSYVEPKKILDGIDMKVANMLNMMANAYRRIPEKDHKKQDLAYDSWINILMDQLPNDY